MDQLIFSDLLISAYGLSSRPMPLPTALGFPAPASAFPPREPLPLDLALGFGAIFAGVPARDEACDEDPLLVSLILVIGFFTAGGAAGGGGLPPGGNAATALNVWR